MKMKIYGYFRSSAAFRLRIALNLKNLDHETELINLQAGDQFSTSFKIINPQGRVPVLDTGLDVLIQSMAIIEYLDESYNDPPLFPQSSAGRARVKGIAQVISCDIHPLNNLAVLNYLRENLNANDVAVEKWYQHWVKQGFDGVEKLLALSKDTGMYCHGDEPGFADICLIPQVFNALRFKISVKEYPTIERIYNTCMEHRDFYRAHPMEQPEAKNLA
ncbi:MAG: maleylacetoacetate isomerase [Rhodospirillaceae bacterium]|nr:maleylacetoacetate isomerase [Rhodospirillaceae bacterium]